jgi:5-methylcytosine-specific restriction endonuclease McrA
MSRYISVALAQQVREHYAERCAYCQSAEALTVTRFEIEHITPLAVGGATTFENLCLACPSCNR